MIHLFFIWIHCCYTGEDNPHHYFIATQDVELRRKLRRIPGNLRSAVIGFYPICTQVYPYSILIITL